MRAKTGATMLAVAALLGSVLTPAGVAMAAVAPGSATTVATLLSELRVVTPSSTAQYDRNLFAENLDADGDGCGTRQEVLIEESEVSPTVTGTCTVVSGQWSSYIDNVLHVDPAAMEMVHLVSLKEAWASGARSWTAAQRDAYANDLDDHRSLIMVTAAVQPAKADKDPALWLPPTPHAHQQCRYIAEWVAVKWRWNLSIDLAEAAAIQKVVTGCGLMTIDAPLLPPDRPAGVGEAATTKYYITNYDGAIWGVTPTTITALSVSEWQAAGSPTPAPAPTDYVKYPWSSTISAVTFFGQDRSRWIWHHVSFTEWSNAGRPAPRIAGWIKDSVYYQWAGSKQIFVQDVGGVKHALSYAEWQQSGFEAFESRTDQGFVKLSWDGNIAFLTDFTTGRGGPITYGQWQAEGFPTPVIASRFPGDQLYKYNGESAVWYAGPTVNRVITYAEWGAAGYPAPSIRRITRTSEFTCPTWAPIKGNANSGIYHVPGGRYYGATNPEECFRSEAAAIGAGYRRSQL